MRLLPENYRGLHPAYPAYPEESAKNRAGFFIFLPTCGAFALPIVPIAAAVRRPHPWATATKAVAYISAGLAGVMALNGAARDANARQFLRTQGIDPPKGRYLDRFGHIDMDDAALIGGTLGVLLTSLRKRPSSIHGWKRYLGAFSLGGAAGMVVWLQGVAAKERQGHTLGEVQKNSNNINELAMQEARWKPAVRRALGKPAEMTISATIHSTPENGTFGALRLPMAGTMGGSSGLQSVGRKTINVPGQPGGDELGKDSPHMTVKRYGDEEPLVIAQPNYDWTSEHDIEDLEKHVAKLRQRRERAAHQSQLLWAWISEKELEYYNDPTMKSDKKRKDAMMHYLGVLGAMHRLTWGQVSSIDWIIADSRKMIEQRRSKQSNAEGLVTWRARCSEAAAQTRTTNVLESLREMMQQTEQVASQLQQMQTQAAIEMADPEFDLKENAQIYHPVKQKVVSEKEAFLDLKKAMDEQMEHVLGMQQAIKEILADGEKKAEEYEKKKG